MAINDAKVAEEIKVDFRYFISLALNDKIPWTSLLPILTAFTQSLADSNQVIEVLLCELERLKLELQKNQRSMSNKDQHSERDHFQNVLQDEEDNQTDSENMPENIGGIEQSSILETKPIDDEIEVLEVVKESINEDIYLDANESPKLYKNLVDKNNEDESRNKDAHKSWDVIENEWYTFVKNDKPCKTVAEEPVQENEFYFENEINENVSEIDKNTTRNKTPTKQMKKHENIHMEEVPFECITCSKRFKHNYVLKRHERIHTGEMPFECKTCKKRFNQSSALKTHERIHTGEVPYECRTCKKRFRVKCNLKIHERNHTGEEPYECNNCGKAFKQRTALICHLKRIHQSKLIK